jgi:hypothetical protein
MTGGLNQTISEIRAILSSGENITPKVAARLNLAAIADLADKVDTLSTELKCADLPQLRADLDDLEKTTGKRIDDFEKTTGKRIDDISGRVNGLTGVSIIASAVAGVIAFFKQ